MCDFEDLFSDVPKQSTVAEHDFVMIENTVPVKQVPYRMSPQRKEILREEVNFLLRHNLIEKSKSEWASCSLIPKPDGSMRMCMESTRSDSFPLPRIDDTSSTRWKMLLF